MIENLFRPMHLILVLLIALVVFGPGKLPQIGKGLGESIQNFKKAMNGGKEDEPKKEVPADTK
jgi:sec-independent protein translocase protein TatA